MNTDKRISSLIARAEKDLAPQFSLLEQRELRNTSRVLD